MPSDELQRRRYRRKHHPEGWRKVLRALRYRAEYGGFLMARTLLRLIGLERASALSGALWRRVAPLTRRHARALAQLQAALPSSNAAEREATARAMWENLGRVMAEALLLDRILAEPERVRLASPEAIDAIVAAGGRAVVVSLHYGNWELVSIPAMRRGLKIAGVYQRILNPLIDRHVVRMRSPLYLGGLHSKGTGAASRLIEWVRGGHIAGVLADQRHARGIEVPFFGRPAPSNTFPAMIARLEGVPLIAARAIREGGVNFRVEARRVPVAVTGDRDADVAAATAAIHALFEAWIREKPEHWMWAHRRWG